MLLNTRHLLFAIFFSFVFAATTVKAQCAITYTVVAPTCSPGNDGKIIVAMPSLTCFPGVTSYSLQISSSCGPVSGLSSIGPGTYTIFNVPSCGFSYGLLVFDQNSTFLTQVSNVNVSAPTVGNFASGTKTINCNSICDASVTAIFVGGNSPYTYTILPPTGGSLTGTSASGGVNATNLCSGFLTIYVKDQSACTGTFTSFFSQPPALNTNSVLSNVKCNGDCTGGFSVSPVGGSPSYTVNFNPGGSFAIGSGGTASLTGLCATGIPILATLTDAKGCTVTAGATVTEPPVLTATPSQTNILCNGANTGAASVLVSGGTPTYAFSWTPASSTSSIITGITAGTQTVTVLDQNSCSTSVVYNITQPSAITLTPTFTNVVCSSSCTGAASVIATGGSSVYIYTWVAPNNSTISSGSANSINNLCAGNYTVYVRDIPNNCIKFAVIAITQPPAVTLTAVSQSITCFGANDGSGTVTATGGNSGAYTYSWTNSSNSVVATGSVATGLKPDTYVVLVRDAQLCPSIINVTILEPVGLTLNTSSVSLTCNSVNAICNGSINVIPAGGTIPYHYTLTTASFSTTSNPPYINLCAGPHTVIVVDNSGCPQQTVITLTQPGALLPTIATTSVNCFGFNTGGLTGNSSTGGTPGYTLTWATPAGPASGAILNNQPAGNYTLFVIDSKSCTAQTTATVTQPSSVTISVGNSTISCYAVCNGVLTSTVSGGTPGYSYAWTNSLNVNVGSAPTATGLCPGSYTLTVTDANLCTRTASGTVVSPAPIVLTSTTTPVNCFGDSNGSASVTASGGTPSFTYNFNSTPTVSNTTGILTGQPAGNYIATVNDSKGCIQTRVFAIASPTALAATLSGTGSCNMCTGSATVAPSFGTGAYTYTWVSSLGGSFPNTATLSNLCPGNYTATIADAKGCVITRSVTLTQIITVTISLGGNSILCNGASTGSATALAGGGIGNYTYSWTPSNQTNSVITGVPAGSYTVKVTDQSVPSSCSHTAAITLSQPPAITVTATQTNVTCFGYNNGSISTTVTGGTGASTYSWSPGNLTTPSISSITAGTYTLRVTDGNLCVKILNYSISQSPSITITHTAVNPSGCAVPNGSICTTPTGGSGSGYTFTWSPPGGSSNCLTGLNGGTYQQTVTDGAGCSNTIAVTLFNATGPTLTAISRSVDCYGASTGAATVTALGAAPFNFVVSPSTPTTPIPSGIIATGMSNGTYVFNCSDVNGCVTSTSIPIAQAPSVTINSAFSNAKCNAVCNGSITVAPAQGTLSSTSYTYSWLPVAPPIAGQGTKTITGLCANNYTLNLTNSPNCVTQYTFLITQPPAFTVSAVTSSLLCYNVCTGSIVANASGGTGSLNYSWTPVGGSSSSITNLCANTGTNPTSYTLTVTDVNSCSLVSTYTLAQPTQLTNTVNILSATCSNSCNAIATQTVSGGTPGYNYSWASSTITTSSLGSLCAGSYTAYVTDGNGCTSAKQYTITAPAPLNVTLTAVNPLCNSACNGSISTSISGAQGAVTYSWAPAGSGQNPVGLCAVPNPVYTLVATDANSCRVIANATLTNPPAIIVGVNTSNPLCHNNADGSAVATLTNAIGAISYTWLPTGPPTQTNQTATGLAFGSYSVLVKDANNCQASKTFTLINPSSLIVNTAINPASCSQSNGGFTVNPSGGTPGSPAPYTYSWTGVVSSASFVTGVPAGTYTVVVADGLGCTNTVSILLNNSSGPNFMPVISNSILCNSKCTGAASVDISNISGGTSPYDINWLLVGGPSTVNPQTNLCSGLYTAKIIDQTGCIGFTTATISEPPPIVVTSALGLPLCPGICNGSVTLNTSGGNAPYTYSWMPVSGNSSVITNLCAGNYSVIIGYNNACSDTAFINLPDQSSITIVPTVTNNICFGTCTGIANVSISGGASPYTAGWSNSQTGFTQTDLCNGSYTVIITDNNGCSNTATAAITSGAQITSSASVVSPSCGACNGTASVSVSGGSSPFNFNWSNAATTPSVSNLCAGIYEVIISDAQSCSQSHTVIVNNSNGISAENFTVQQIPCSGSCVGAATVLAVGGTAPINYNWVNPVSTTSVISSLCPGTYFVQMSDALGCIRTSSVTINPLVTLSVSPFVYLPACGANNGSISIAIAGGTPSYSIVWNPPAGQTTSLTNLTTGVYSYTVTESGTYSCSVSQSINISNSAGPAITSSLTNVNCYGTCTGSITTSTTGTNVPLVFGWSTGASTPSLTNLCKGVLTLTVTDAIGCKSIKSFTVTENPELHLGLSNVKSPKCFGDCDGSIRLVPNGGVLPYLYSWSLPNANSNPVTALCDGTYTASVKDSKGCMVSSPTFTIKSASSLSLAANTVSSSCISMADGAINLTPSGGIGEYIFTWQGPSNYTAVTQNISNLFAGTYTVKVMDDLGCVKNTTLDIVSSLTVVANAGGDRIICPETGTVILTANSSGGSNYKWYSAKDPGKLKVLATGDSYLVEKLSESSGFVLVATSTVPSCYSEDEVRVDVFNISAVDAGRDVTIPVYSTVTIGGHPTNWGPATLTWSPAMYLSNASISNPVASNTVDVTYTLTVMDENGCFASDSVHVFLYPELNITSGFTPNGDGKNDTWIIDYIDQFPATTVDIYNRWGDSVFSSTGYGTAFDGKYKGSDLPVGTYYYIIKLNHPGYPKPITGPLTIFR